MKDLKLPNFFFTIIAVIIGVSLYKLFDFEKMTFAKPALAIVYFIALAFCIFGIIKNYRKPLEKEE